VRRGEVWEADLPHPIKRRPVLILSRDQMPVGRQEITVAFVTSKLRNTPAQVRLTPAEGLRLVSEVNLDSINTIPKDLLVKRLGMLSATKMLEVAAAINFALDLP